MIKFFEKIKFLAKERRRDTFYIASIIILLVITASLSIWAVQVAFRAIDAVFLIGGPDSVSEVLAFNLETFNQIAPRLKINFPEIQ